MIKLVCNKALYFIKFGRNLTGFSGNLLNGWRETFENRQQNIGKPLPF